MAEGGKRITVTVKTPKEKQNIEIDEDETVEKVRERFDTDLINAAETLKSHTKARNSAAVL